MSLLSAMSSSAYNNSPGFRWKIKNIKNCLLLINDDNDDDDNDEGNDNCDNIVSYVIYNVDDDDESIKVFNIQLRSLYKIHPQDWSKSIM